MVINQATYDRYAEALKSYEKVVELKGDGWEAYQEEAEKIRNFLAGSTVEVIVSQVLGNI